MTSLRKRVAALEEENLDRLRQARFTVPFSDPDAVPVNLRVVAVPEVGDLGERLFAAAIQVNNRTTWQDSRLVDDEDAAKRIARARIHRSLTNLFGGTK